MIEAWIAGTWVLIRMECLLVINFIQMQETYVGWLLMRSPFPFRELPYLTCKQKFVSELTRGFFSPNFCQTL